MGRVATWQRGPDDPASLAEWLFRRRVVASGLDAKGLAGGVLAAGLLMGSLFALRVPGHVVPNLWPFAPYAVLIVPGAVRWRRRASAAHRELPCVGLDHAAWPVCLTVFDTSGRKTGFDEGWIGFADGWLVYEGLRTAFAIGAGEVAHSQRWVGEVALRLDDGRRIGLRLLSDGGTDDLRARPQDDTAFQRD